MTAKTKLGDKWVEGAIFKGGKGRRRRRKHRNAEKQATDIKLVCDEEEVEEAVWRYQKNNKTLKHGSVGSRNHETSRNG